MLVLILKRLLLSVPTLAGIVVVTFALTRLLPGDPAAYFAGNAASVEAVHGEICFGEPSRPTAKTAVTSPSATPPAAPRPPLSRDKVPSSPH